MKSESTSCPWCLSGQRSLNKEKLKIINSIASERHFCLECNSKSLISYKKLVEENNENEHIVSGNLYQRKIVERIQKSDLKREAQENVTKQQDLDDFF